MSGAVLPVMGALHAACRAFLDECRCSLCGEPWRKASTFPCGHTFCSECAVATLEGPGISQSECPTCKAKYWKRDLRSNPQLASVVEHAQKILGIAGPPYGAATAEGNTALGDVLCSDQPRTDAVAAASPDVECRDGVGCGAEACARKACGLDGPGGITVRQPQASSVTPEHAHGQQQQQDTPLLGPGRTQLLPVTGLHSDTAATATLGSADARTPRPLAGQTLRPCATRAGAATGRNVPLQLQPQQMNATSTAAPAGGFACMALQTNTGTAASTGCTGPVACGGITGAATLPAACRSGAPLEPASTAAAGFVAPQARARRPPAQEEGTALAHTACCAGVYNVPNLCGPPTTNENRAHPAVHAVPETPLTERPCERAFTFRVCGGAAGTGAYRSPQLLHGSAGAAAAGTLATPYGGSAQQERFRTQSQLGASLAVTATPHILGLPPPRSQPPAAWQSLSRDRPPCGQQRPGSVVSIRRGTPSVNNAYLEFHNLLEEAVHRMMMDVNGRTAQADAAPGPVIGECGGWDAFSEAAWLRRLAQLPGPTHQEREALECELGIVEMFLEELDQQLLEAQAASADLASGPSEGLAAASNAVVAAPGAAQDGGAVGSQGVVEPFTAAPQPGSLATGAGDVPPVVPDAAMAETASESHRAAAVADAVRGSEGTAESLRAAGDMRPPVRDAVTVSAAGELHREMQQQQQHGSVDQAEDFNGQRPLEGLAGDTMSAADTGTGPKRGGSCERGTIASAGPSPPPTNVELSRAEGPADAGPVPAGVAQPGASEVSPAAQGPIAGPSFRLDGAGHTNQLGESLGRRRSNLGTAQPGATALDVEQAARTGAAAGPRDQWACAKHADEDVDLDHCARHKRARTDAGTAGPCPKPTPPSAAARPGQRGSSANVLGQAPGAWTMAEPAEPRPSEQRTDAGGDGVDTREQGQPSGAALQPGGPKTGGDAQAVDEGSGQSPQSPVKPVAGPQRTRKLPRDAGATVGAAAGEDDDEMQCTGQRRRRRGAVRPKAQRGAAPQPPSGDDEPVQQPPRQQQQGRKEAQPKAPAAQPVARRARRREREPAAPVGATQAGVADCAPGGALSRRGKPVYALSTGLSAQERDKLKELARRVRSLEILEDVIPTMTHLVVSLTPEGRAAVRTVKYLRAVMQGCWVVGVNWAEASLAAGRLLPEAEYEATGDPYHDGAPCKGRLRLERGEAPLFQGVSFCVSYLKTQMEGKVSRTDVEALLQTAGGCIIRRPSTRSAAGGADTTAAAAIFGMDAVADPYGDKPTTSAQQQQQADADASPGVQRPPGLPAVAVLMSTANDTDAARVVREWGCAPINTTWVYDSISYYRVLPVEPYMILPESQAHTSEMSTGQ